jgi:hypothetical protein
VIVAGRVSQKREIARSGKGDVLRCGGFLFVIGRIEGRCPLELPRQGYDPLHPRCSSANIAGFISWYMNDVVKQTM